MSPALRSLWQFALLVFLCIGGWKYFTPETETPSLALFIPAAIILGTLIIVEVMSQIVAIFTQYDITTWVAIVAISGSLVTFYFGIVEKDPGRSWGLIAFSGSILGFGTGISFSRITQRKRNGL
jgi:phosphoglycerol transferase MdoB-like AlkP superfamily enzyme